MSNYQDLKTWKKSEQGKAITSKTQTGRVIIALTETGSWYTLREIESVICARFEDKDTQAAISARLREIKPSKHGLVKQKRVIRKNNKNVYRYRLVPTFVIRALAKKVGAA